MTSPPATDVLNLQQAEEQLLHAVRKEEEADAMLLLAERDAEELAARNTALRSENAWLRNKVGAKRSVRRELAEVADYSDVYDWVCEITKLSDVGTAGWKVQYSAHFLNSMSEEERRFVMGTEPLPFSPSKATAGTIDDEDDDDASEGTGLSKGWDGAVVAVLGVPLPLIFLHKFAAVSPPHPFSKDCFLARHRQACSIRGKRLCSTT
mgnify:CR=1 FL=1|jgi:hypothetical protein